jgi:hypothetical protein
MSGDSGAILAPEGSSGDTGLPKLFQHCIRLYELMEQDAKDASDGKVYEGSLGKLISSMGVSQSYHSKIVGRLKAMRCIAMRKRGSGTNTKSIWSLHGAPTIEEFNKTDNTGDATWIQRQEVHDAHEQRITDLTRRISNIEDYLREQGMAV